jgi:S-DNA-T family DNA segregation ATPase FtsK/SpoIIIE
MRSRESTVTPDQVEPEHWTVKIDDDAEQLADVLDIDHGTPVTVDPPQPDTAPEYGLERWRRQWRERPAIVPRWLRSSDERKATVRWAIRYVSYVGAYHLLRCPKYALRIVTRAPRGVVRIVGGTARWAADVESRPLRVTAVEERATGEYLRLLSAHRTAVHRRALLCGVALCVIAGSIAVSLSPTTAGWVKAVSLATVLLVLGLVGRRHDQPVVDRAMVRPLARKLTADVVTRAFIAASLCKGADPVTFPQPIQRDGNGWRAVIDLPWGVTAEQAIKRRDRLASGLDLDEVQVWPERVRGTTGSARRVALWVADEDPYAKPSGRWPWAEDRTETSLFDPLPFGQDQRGRLVELRLMFTSVLVGAIPRMGKTLAARLLLLAAALDPYVQLHVYDGKGGQDWRPFARLAHRCGFGARSEVVQRLRNDLRELHDDMNDRYDRMAELPADLSPEARVTPRLASNIALKLHPIVIGIDECQRYFEDPTYGDEIVSLLTELAKVGPAVGIIVVPATQKPDAHSVPTRLRDVIGTRFALKTMTYQSSEAVLGAGSYSAGYDASRVQRAHKGVGWLIGADDSGDVDDAVVVRSFLTTAADVEQVIERARAARIAAGTLSGVAAGEETDQVDRVSVLDDVHGVFAPGEERLWSERILDRLAALRPGYYAGWTPAQLAAALKPYGIATRQVWGTTDHGDQANRRGIDRDDVDAARSEK